ncbi:MAG TPA: SAM-dependent methyltransferase [Saprospiraceae bacterium]|nr:SAM-dependent methyltransferase [Saprospiraceae bacterium]HMP22487.1 SAM-dependent methyltransferase [Saprospiraceae bacterium]
MQGKLYLIPVPLGESAEHTIPPYVAAIVQQLDILIAERAKTARHFIKAICPGKSLDLTIHELNKHTPPEDIDRFLDAAAQGQDLGLMSEAGAPGVADPGAVVVWLAHQRGIEVVPLVGPSSILLALMASGMNGQSFCFQGYLAPKKPDLEKDLKRIEQLSAKLDQTQLFIETPYRNTNLVETALQTLAPSTKFCIAADLTLPTEWVHTHTILQWRTTLLPDLHKRPAIFLLYAR